MADNPKRILIVEDNDCDVRLLKDILETRGYDILQTDEGLEAIDLAVGTSRSYPDGYPITRHIRAGSDPPTER